MDVTAVFWAGKRVLLTGHTGFKGSWLSLWLAELGADVHGFALQPPTTPSLFETARVASRLASSTIGDIRDSAAIAAAIRAVDPEIVLHLAAQPLVRMSYQDPVGTYSTNVMGTVHVLEAARSADRLRVIVNVTTDKCYENDGRRQPYQESDPMGGHDPYSSSKGCAELVTTAYRRSFLAGRGVRVATARAGNVIGGGDWSADRLVPDFLRALDQGKQLVIRSPDATRPWQHVLEPLSGYLMLARHLWQVGEPFDGAWNFGPSIEDSIPVRSIVQRLCDATPGSSWTIDAGAHPHEAHALSLDSSNAHTRLGWRPRWDVQAAIDQTIAWHQAWRAGHDMDLVCIEQLRAFGTEA